MADAILKLPDDSTNGGKQVDLESVTVNSLAVYRERIEIAGSGATQIASVQNTATAGTEQALVTRAIVNQLPAALGASGGMKVHIAGDDIGSAVEGTDNTAVVTLNSKFLTNGTTVLTPKFATIVASASGDTAVVAAVSSKKIRVLAYVLTTNAAVNSKFRSGTSDITGLLYGGTDTVFQAAFNPLGHFETVATTALNINLSGAVAVGGHITYAEV